jgi:hypothetical protein
MAAPPPPGCARRTYSFLWQSFVVNMTHIPKSIIYKYWFAGNDNAECKQSVIFRDGQSAALSWLAFPPWLIMSYILLSVAIHCRKYNPYTKIDNLQAIVA